MAEEKKFDYESAIWGVADYVRDVIKRSEYNRIVLPFSLLRRLECALEPTRQKVLDQVKEHETDWGVENDNYCQFSGKPFYNTTAFRLNNLGSTNTLEALKAYVDGFSENARSIFHQFRLEETAGRLQEHNMLYAVCQKFSEFDLSPETVSDREMSNIYEHLIQRYGESVAEDAEDFMTPEDVAQLSISMLFAEDEEFLHSDQGYVRTIYDPTLGTGSFITSSLDTLEAWQSTRNMKSPAVIVPFGQEIEGESWAIAKANLMLRNVSNTGKDAYDSIKDMSEHIAQGDTLADDKFEGRTFNFIVSNPPYGKDFSQSLSKVEEEARLGFKGRWGAGIPPKSDGSMLFLQHCCAKMAPVLEGGGKVGIVLSASPLFGGDAGSAQSNIRRWLFEKDYIECIVKLPGQLFFRTGINTYLWILSNHKPENRKHMIQLIDASSMTTSLKKNLGNKRYEVSEADRDWIVSTYINGEQNDKSVIVPDTDFMFRKVTTHQPLRMGYLVNDETKAKLLQHPTYKEMSQVNREIMQKCFTFMPTKMNYPKGEAFFDGIRKQLQKPAPTPSKYKSMINEVFGDKSATWDVVRDKKGNLVPDPDKNDTENIPWNTSFDAYMEKEVLPFASETWIDESVIDKGSLADGKVGVVGTNINFNKYFYHYEMPRRPEEIETEIHEMAIDIESDLENIFGDSV